MSVVWDVARPVGALAWWVLQVAGVWVLAVLGAVLVLRRAGVAWTPFAAARAGITAVLLGWLALRYGDGGNGDWFDVVGTKYYALTFTGLVLVAALSVVFVATAPDGVHADRVERLFVVRGRDGVERLGPLSTAIGLGLIASIIAWVLTTFDDRYASSLTVAIGMILMILPAVAFFVLIPVSVSGTVFNAGHTNPAMPAVAAPFMVIAGVVAETFTGGVSAAPDGLRTPVSVFGVLAITALSAAELRWVYRHRSGFLRAAASQARG
ncbi:hypothetical protein [Nocardia sp. NPDC057668]|uniref:hypothetical protein n=1 Tax=Nocardia sp. NPDC057668 TaxID=3346202 RepID=UPI0036709521